MQFIDRLLVELDAGVYYFINQGCLTVDTINDLEEMNAVNVCPCTEPCEGDSLSGPERACVKLRFGWSDASSNCSLDDYGLDRILIFSR